MNPAARQHELTIAERFGRKLFMARRHAGLSQEALSKAAGLNRTVVGLLENGRRTPKLDTISALAGALELTPGELIDGPRRDRAAASDD